MTMFPNDQQTDSLSEHERINFTAQADMLDRPCRIQQQAPWTSSNEQTDIHDSIQRGELVELRPRYFYSFTCHD